MTQENDRVRYHTGQLSTGFSTEEDRHNAEIATLQQAMNGDLLEKPISYLLKVAAHYEATGHLHVGSQGFGVTIQFGLGKAVHAVSPFQKGEEAIIDLFTWTDGPLAFEYGKQPDKVTVAESSENLISRGTAYVNDLAFLDENQITESSFLTRAGKLSSKELEIATKTSTLYKPELLVEFYGNIYGTLNLKDAAARMDLTRSKWVSIAASLLRLGLLLSPDGRSLKIAVTSPPPVAPSPMLMAVQTPAVETPFVAGGVRLPRRAPDGDATVGPASVPLPKRHTDSVTISIKKSLDEMNTDLGANMPDMPRAASSPFLKVGVSQDTANYGPSDLASFWNVINTTETGILSREMFLFMLSHEFSTAHRFQEILTLAVFSIKFDSAPDDLVPIEDVRQIIRAVEKVKRDVDLFGHFGDRSFALLLPRVDSARTCILVDRINERLPEMVPALASAGPRLYFGLATAPNDAASLAPLVKVAHGKMQAAASQGLHRLQPV